MFSLTALIGKTGYTNRRSLAIQTKMLYTMPVLKSSIKAHPEIHHQVPIVEPIIEPTAQTFYKMQVPIAAFPPQYFNGLQLLNLYNIPAVLPSTNIRKVKIAVIIAYTYKGLIADLNTYWTNPINFGENSVPPKVNIYTMPGAIANIGWAQEECLDVQMVCTMNPNAEIWVVEAKSSTITDLMAAVQYATNTIKADVLSMSWGNNDVSSNTKYNTYFSNPTASFCAASGDSNVVSWPAVLSNSIAVGGTTLLWTPSAQSTGTSFQRTEYTWDSAGCGYSRTVLQPAYQQGVSTINHAYRAIPDVAMVGNTQTCVYSVYAGQWYGVGGTSVATPIFAAVVSLANQVRLNMGKSILTSVYPATNNIQNYLYKTIYTNPTAYKADFYDVVMGTDLGSVGGASQNLTTYTAGTGYDLTTGLGSPNCNNLCIDLAKI
jgi:subtilase family serine protease